MPIVQNAVAATPVSTNTRKNNSGFLITKANIALAAALKAPSTRTHLRDHLSDSLPRRGFITTWVISSTLVIRPTCNELTFKLFTA